MAATEQVFTKLTLVWQLFIKNSGMEFHENPTNISVVYTNAQTDRQTCDLHTTRYFFYTFKKVHQIGSVCNVALWRVRVTTVAVETQQCILYVVLSSCRCRTTMFLCQIHAAGNNAYCPVLHRLLIVLQTHSLAEQIEMTADQSVSLLYEIRRNWSIMK